MNATVEALGATPPQLLQTVHAHRGEVTCCDAYGVRMVTGGGDGTLWLWAWHAGEGGWQELSAVTRAHRYGITTARLAPAGTLLASGGIDGAARVWAVRGETLDPRVLLTAGGAAAVRSLCWAGGGGARLATGHDDGAVLLWHVRRAVMLTRLLAHQGALHALAVPARSALLLAACTEGVLKVFDLQEVCRRAVDDSSPPSPLLWVDGAHDLGVLCAEASSDGQMAATGGHDARICLWVVTGAHNARRMRAGVTLEGHSAAVTALRWANADVLASASLDRTARLWAVDKSGTDGSCIVVLHAHTRYLTCVVLSSDLRYMLTGKGSNDKSVRMWSLGSLSLDDDLKVPCVLHAHFAVGDLEGIGPVDDDEILQLEVDDNRLQAVAAELRGEGDDFDDGCAVGGGARCVWRSASVHGAAINCIAVHRDILATACSDGAVRIFRWSEEHSTLHLERMLGEVELGSPAFTVDVGAGGELLLTGGLSGVGRLYDINSGCELRTLAPPTAPECESGGGGVRSVRISPHRPTLLLLATDDGVAPVWSLVDSDPEPLHVYGGHPEAVLCCAWSPDGKVAVTGGAAGELRLHSAPPYAKTLHHCADAHDLGVQSCDFASEEVAQAAGITGEDQHLLATAGSDDLIKLWMVELDEVGETATLQELHKIAAHGGGAASVRWSRPPFGGALLSSGGADLWARVWRVTAEGTRMRAIAAVPVYSAGGAGAVALLDGGLLALGTLTGELTLWRLPKPGSAAEEETDCDAEDDINESEGEAGEDVDDDVGVDVRWWGVTGVVRWMRDYVTRAPGCGVSLREAERAEEAVRKAKLNGSRLLDEPVEILLELLGYEAALEQPVEEEVDKMEESDRSERQVVRARIKEELEWMRVQDWPHQMEKNIVHALRCPLTHRALREPARAADGGTYERLALHEWFLAAGGPVSAISGRRLRNGRIRPNLRAARALRALYEHYNATDAVA